MGSFSLVAVNIQSMVTEMEQSAEIVLTVRDSIPESEARSLGSEISKISNVKESSWFSREDALKEWEEKNGSLAVQGLPDDIFPHRYRIYLVDVKFAEDTAERLAALKNVESVEVERDLLNALLSVRSVVQVVSAALIASLFIVSLFIMQNTIKLATFERREEIAIMRVVGATKGFIRNPFIVEGFILGLLAGLCAYFVQAAVYKSFEGIIVESIDIFTPVPFAELWMPVFIFFLAIGFLVGVFGSLMTIRKYLKV